MKLGRCPVCGHRMVLVKRSRCGCGKRHTGVCPLPTVWVVVRAHDCGRGLRPHGSEEMRTA